MSLLEIRDVEVEFRSRSRGTVRAVDGVSLDVERGQVVGLVGESGCGKSSLARAVVGLEPVTTGSVLLDGAPVAPLRWRRRSAHDVRMQMVFQNPYGSLNPRRTIGSQLRDGLRTPAAAADPDGEVRRLLDLVGLDEDAAQRYPHQFSGGQRQRVVIARALAADPDVLVADEPVTALDASSQAQVVNLLVRLVRELGLGMLFISHDLALVHEIADVTAVMYLGRIVESGPTGQVWASPQHPYTRALIDALPRISAHPTLPVGLRGEVPDAARIPTGCRFRPRCPRAMDVCTGEPPVVQIGQQWSACWLHAQETAGTGAGVTEGRA
ncbi:ABC transporter ATP-binding protein [Cellulomonas dongxiuzhuiae]|uniref:ABC transporter ATP-binding protein n=1 Tax=Cellulomonas dongxiuzhuiae TaxID=2819979 RepID=A0ABX8GIV8_9CELL|nr:ABC transporter ATP-binding protein [Cellulomonas dongxiuzhuiae]MBO3088222.1 ABC transporter ATP-binding protein [Cellulomonas dongxiuzhuiae]MBO3094431.1 ABC transporter ATP-binding protein [Cellulomonas dongxiuzhuiae]QWC15456.1 ABC transporter ATP-binding protein [Cellulomonas dongxiuzhuiae]